MGGTASTGNDDLKAGRLGALGEAIEPLGGAMRRDDTRLVRYAERGQGHSGVTHGVPVGLASHDNGNGDGHSESSKKSGKEAGL